jgi:hypothetical protein
MDCYSYPDHLVLHEESCDDYGVFSIVKKDSYASHDDYFVVVWRANRNATRDTTMMRSDEENPWDRVDIHYDTLNEAIESIPHWNKTFKTPKKFKSSRPRDSQKQKMYLWEHAMAAKIGPEEFVETNRYPSGDSVGVMHNKLELKRSHRLLQNVLDHVCLNLGEKTPELKFRTGGSHSFGGYSIQLLPCHCNYLVLLHELAHVLHRRWGTRTDGKRHQSHGQEFVGIYAYLLIRFGEIDKDAILQHAAQSKIKLLLPEQYWTWATTTEQKAA